MRVLLVVAHPVPESLCRHLATHAETILRQEGHEVDRLDLYDESFRPVLTEDERRSYGPPPVAPDPMAERLQSAEALVLVFPTWWFSVPAILKGWFDRVWLPGVAFEPGTPIKPLLMSLRSCLVITTLGSPWWFDWLVMWRPVGRVLRRGILLACAPQARFHMCSLHNAEAVVPARLEHFEQRIGRALQRLR